MPWDHTEWIIVSTSNQVTSCQLSEHSPSLSDAAAPVKIRPAGWVAARTVAPPRRLGRALGLAAALVLVVAGRWAWADEQIPADPELRWWKGNIHTHTLWSDGNDFPEMVAEWYRTHGYNFLALSDHNILSQGQRWMKLEDVRRRGGEEAMAKYLARFGSHWVEQRQREDGQTEVRLKPLSEFRALVEERGKFLMIPGEEISDRVGSAPVHMNATNIQELQRPVGGATVREAIENNLRAIQEQAERTGNEILVHLNHPNFGWGVTAEDMAAVLAERFFEVFNGHPAVNQLGDDVHPGVERLWDIANTLRLGVLGGEPLFGVATDDSHSYHEEHGARPGRGWIMVRARHLTPESLIRAMRAGDFYASSGVLLEDVRFDSGEGRLTIRIAAEEGVKYQTEFIGTRRDYDASSEPRVDAEGNPLPVTRRYSAEVGEVLAVAEGREVSYQLKGDELYVRAVITSDRPPADLAYPGQLQQAWTQPVGWR